MPMGEASNSGVFGAQASSWRDMLTAPLERVRKRVGKSKYSAADSIESITTVIESEIIPRLLMAHDSGSGDHHSPRIGVIDGADVNRFINLPLQLEAAGLLDEIDALIERGASVEAICVDLLAPAARRLGEMWDRDECDFIDVTMGLWRLQEVMREISARSPSLLPQVVQTRSALFSPMPGDIHNFGTQMIEEVFGRAGWQSEALVKPERRDLLDRLARKPFDLVGLTLSRDCPSAALGNLIRAIRGVSANPHISVIVGGRVVNQNPEIVAESGADGTSSDALGALQLAEKLVLCAPIKAHSLR
jgi:MerR family transcriptional regulator, light-induced transcriptional regulator